MSREKPNGRRLVEMHEDYGSLNHTRWECKYHVVFIPKCRRRTLYGDLRKYLGELFHDLAKMKESEVLEGHLHRDHVHMLLSIPPKNAVSDVVGFLKGKSAIAIARNYIGKKNLRGEQFWARGYLVSTVGKAEATIRQYIQNQQTEDKRLDQLQLFK
jgi:putative transposase